jgi:wyosine [tRNA(Phe)-imidazoG37] synthetase (radical SAM superfamily)
LSEVDLAFGPVPSRRLGRSLGVNNIPPKICTYSCVYCQLGNTIKMSVERRHFYGSEKVIEAVRKKAEKVLSEGGKIDYVTFVPDGEPTLDVDIGDEIRGIKNLGFKVAVITNSSLIWDEDVRGSLLYADWVSLKLDAFTEDVWRRVNRPHKVLRLSLILEWMKEFSREFKGYLATETMLVKGVNDSLQEIRLVADFLTGLRPRKAYISIPTRPPAEKWVRPPEEGVLNLAYQTFREKGLSAELLTGFEGTEFTWTGDVVKDLLSITSVHPMRDDAVDEFLRKAGSDWDVVRRLISEGKLVELTYGGRKYYLRRLRRSYG